MDKKKLTLQQRRELPAEHKGMPAKEPQAQENMVGKPLTARDVSSEMSLHLPHERDQSTDMTPQRKSPLIEQAYKDESRGLKDTSKQPEMDEAYKKQR